MKFSENIKKLQESINTLTVIRVPYGKADVPEKDREFKLPSTGIVGNTKEWTAFAKKKGYKYLQVIDGNKKKNIKVEKIGWNALAKKMFKKDPTKLTDKEIDEVDYAYTVQRESVHQEGQSQTLMRHCDAKSCDHYKEMEGTTNCVLDTVTVSAKGNCNQYEPKAKTMEERFQDKYDAIAWAKSWKKKGWSIDKIEKKIASEFKDPDDIDYIMGAITEGMKLNEAVSPKVKTVIQELKKNVSGKPGIYTINDFVGSNTGTLKVGINWPALGTVTVQETQKFKQELDKAIKKAEKINNMKIPMKEWNARYSDER